MARPNTVTMQYIVLFSHRMVQLPVRERRERRVVKLSLYQHLLVAHAPSVELSQKHELAVCSPAPFFCMMTQVTV